MSANVHKIVLFFILWLFCWGYIDGLVQERRNSSALAMELRLSWIKPSISTVPYRMQLCAQFCFVHFCTIVAMLSVPYCVQICTWFCCAFFVTFFYWWCIINALFVFIDLPIFFKVASQHWRMLSEANCDTLDFTFVWKIKKNVRCRWNYTVEDFKHSIWNWYWKMTVLKTM